MTGTKGHSGGKRTGQGRPPKQGKQYHITIRCSDMVYEKIMEFSTPESRAIYLWNMANENEQITSHPAY